MKHLPLTQGKFAQVDDADFERCAEHKWCASFESSRTKYYAKRRVKKVERERWKTQNVRLGHFILDKASWEIPGHVIDHLNSDSLDYRRENLEIIPEELNMKRCKTWNQKKELTGPCL